MAITTHNIYYNHQIIINNKIYRCFWSTCYNYDFYKIFCPFFDHLRPEHINLYIYYVLYADYVKTIFLNKIINNNNNT